ncbi:MAG: NAD(P)-dependent oxidoreductase, partial [Halalkalicoccus sp.]
REIVGTYYTTPIETDHETIRLDVRDSAQVERVIERVDPDVVVHSAAATSVEDCEGDPELARATNALGTEHVVDAASNVGARVVYPSTAYVFGDDAAVHAEDDEPRPLNVYGESKLDGERYVREHCPDGLIVRFCVVVSLDGSEYPDFGSWVRGQLAADERVRLIDDQRITPTALPDAIDGLEFLIERGASGRFHIASPDRLTRYELGREIARRGGFDPELVERIGMAEMGWDAPRPRRLCLSAEKLRRQGYEPTRIRSE